MITIQTKKVEKALLWYADHKIGTGTLFETQKGHLLRIIEYWKEGDAGATKSRYGVLTMTKNKFEWMDESMVLLAIEKGNMWEVEIIANN